ncbi:MAG: hypothetical protein AABW63_03525 [Nanoarchaeota archaeon]
MLKRLNKRGQFYLIAAIVIISLIIGFFLISNSSKKKEQVRVYELSDQLKIEGQKVVDYSIANNDKKIKEFTKNFSDYAGKDIDIVYITGNYTVGAVTTFINNLEVFRYNTTEMQENVNYSIISNYQTGGGNLTLPLNGIDYNFLVYPSENFYFVMTQTLNGEKYVARN